MADRNNKRRKKKKTAFVYILRRIYAILFLAAAITGIVLSLTVFFNIENIEVRGVLEIYTKQEVSNASGLRKGDNIFRFSAYNTKNRIMRELPYISEAVIKRYLPSTVIITVKEADNALVLVCEGGFLVLSQDMRIINSLNTYSGKSLMIYGIDPNSRKVGDMLETENESSVKNLQEMVSYLSSMDLLSDASAINTSDKLDLFLLMDDRVLVKFGTSGDMERKFLMLSEMMSNQLSPEDTGILDLSVSGKATFAPRSGEEMEEAVEELILN
ncbi:MAG: FtsQ-type POTRA domain-containing protein [Oscillospiraceae bacterium]|nr:FtsQ-type POTRA domain-containing protein [Oscillospiraceae bacterium]